MHRRGYKVTNFHSSSPFSTMYAMARDNRHRIWTTVCQGTERLFTPNRKNGFVFEHRTTMVQKRRKLNFSQIKYRDNWVRRFMEEIFRREISAIILPRLTSLDICCLSSSSTYSTGCVQCVLFRDGLFWSLR